MKNTSPLHINDTVIFRKGTRNELEGLKRPFLCPWKSLLLVSGRCGFTLGCLYCTSPRSMRNRDTVASCGLFGRHLPFTASNHIIRVFRHALALDERRSKFKPNPWHRNAHSPQAAANDPDQGTPIIPPLDNGPHRKETANDFLHSVRDELRKKRKKETVWSDDREAYDLAVTNMECDIREVWFPGCHAGT